MPSLTEYKADVERRGGYFFASLPSNAPVARGDVGKPGARFPAYSAARSYTWEIAPDGVPRAGALSVSSILDSIYTYAADNPLGLSTFDEDLEGFQDGEELGHKVIEKLPSVPSLLDVIAAALGIPKPLLIVILLFVGYALLRGAGVVPPLKKVIA